MPTKVVVGGVAFLMGVVESGCRARRARTESREKIEPQGKQ
jgi:hypothetical protein